MVNPTSINALELLRIIGLDFEDELMEVDFINRYNERVSEEPTPVDEGLLRELKVSSRDFRFISSVAFAYSTAYDTHSKNRDKKHLASRKFGSVLREIVESGLPALLGSINDLDELDGRMY